MTQEKSIVLLICYFGKLPWYFDYFVHSCKYNPTVDFLIITDDETNSTSLPNNVRLIYKSLTDLNTLATEQLGFQTSIISGYKLCDFKPAYGVIFSDLIKTYDFWGHCDIDIIFGDIRDFMTYDLLQNHDLISVRHDWLTGCFLLYKNNEKLNKLFLNSKDYKKVLSSDRHYCFDETNFAHDAFTAGKTYDKIETEIESMMHVVKRLENDNYIKPYFEFCIIEGTPGRLRWENGKMFYRNKFEILFYHLIYFKKRYILKRKSLNIPNSFTISPSKIYH